MKKWIINIIALLAIWGALALTAHAQVNGQTTGYTCTTTSQQLLVANGNRRGIVMQNQSTTAVLYCGCNLTINIGLLPLQAPGMAIPPGGTWEPYGGFSCQTAWNCALAKGAAPCAVTEY